MRTAAVFLVVITLTACGGKAKRPVIPAATTGPAKGAIADGSGASHLSAYGGDLVFSRRDGKRYWLMHWRDGRLTRLPIPSQARPFDADAGPDENGKPVVVYSASRRLMRLRLDGSSTPRALGIAGVTHPSTWRGRIAYVHGRDVLVRLRGKTRPRRMARAARVTSLDLGSRAVVFTADHATRDLGETEWTLQVAPLDGERPKTMVSGYVSGACGFVRPIDPTAHGKGVFWVATGASCDTTRTIFAEADLHYRHPRSAGDSEHLILGATRDATATYWLRASAKTRVEVPYPTACEDVRCTIVRLAQPRWRARTPGRPFGPHPEG
jgi:hypothetical protein